MPFVAVAKGVVLVVSMPDNTFYAIDASSGQERWRNGYYLVLSSPAIAHGIAYFPGNNQLLALDIDTGQVRWKFDIPGGSNPPVAVRRSDTVYLGAASLIALSASTGEELWRFNPEPGGNGGVAGNPAVSGGIVYFGFCLRFEGDGCSEYDLYAVTGSQN